MPPRLCARMPPRFCARMPPRFCARMPPRLRGGRFTITLRTAPRRADAPAFVRADAPAFVRMDAPRFCAHGCPRVYAAGGSPSPYSPFNAPTTRLSSSAPRPIAG
jgi:hypothetical protein